MSECLFTDKSVKPNDQLLSEVLGKTFKYWNELRTSLEKEFGPLTEEWKYYGAKYGWGLKTLLKKRNLFFFAPYNKYFKIAFIFGDKAVTVIKKSDLPKNLIDEISSAKKYAEGTGITLEIHKREDTKFIKKLVEIKINN